MKTLCTLFAALVATISLRAELTIVSTEHRDTSYFKRLSEYFTGKENPGRYRIVRTDPAHRDGFYVSLKVDEKDELSQVAAIRLSYVSPDSPAVTTKELPVANHIRKRRVLVGLTDTVWEAKDARPTAWKIDFLNASGAIIDSSKSFLWSNP